METCFAHFFGGGTLVPRWLNCFPSNEGFKEENNGDIPAKSILDICCDLHWLDSGILRESYQCEARRNIRSRKQTINGRRRAGSSAAHKAIGRRADSESTGRTLIESTIHASGRTARTSARQADWQL